MERFSEILNWFGDSLGFMVRVLPVPLVLVLGLALPADALFMYFLPPADEIAARLWMSRLETGWEFLLWTVGAGVLNASLHGAASTGTLSYRTALADATRRLPALLGAALLAGALVSLGFVLLIAPGVFLAVQFAMVPSLVVVEGLGPVEALRESFQRVSGCRWKVFVLYVILGLLLLAWLAPAVGAFLAGGRYATGLLVGLGKGLVACFGITCLFTLYWWEGRSLGA